MEKPRLFFLNIKLSISFNTESFSRVVFKPDCILIKTLDDLKKKNPDAQAGLQTN